METDPLLALWNAMRSRSVPAFNFDQMKAAVDRRFHWLSLYAAEFDEFISLLTIFVLEAINDSTEPMTLAAFNHSAGRAAYRLRKSFEQVATPLKEIPDKDASSPQAALEMKDSAKNIQAALMQHFDASELALLDWTINATQAEFRSLARKLQITEQALKRRKQRLLVRLRDLNHLLGREE